MSFFSMEQATTFLRNKTELFLIIFREIFTGNVLDTNRAVSGKTYCMIFSSFLIHIFTQRNNISIIMMTHTKSEVPKCEEISWYLWSANVSAFSRLRVPAVANMMVVSRSAMIPETALPAVIHAWVPRLPA